MSPRIENNARFSLGESTELGPISACAMAAFTTFAVFGPPWWSDAGVLPAVLIGTAARPPLSRVAWGPDGQVVGHALWNRGKLFLAGAWREAAWLAPLSVRPAWQGQGVGSALMRDGIAALAAGGVQILIILGHEGYYPRFGLRTGCFGRGGVQVDLPAPLAHDPEGWCLRPVKESDATACLELWESLHAGVDGAIHPGSGLLPWVSRTRDIAACVLEHRGQTVGHARLDLRADAERGGAVLRFLARDPESAGVLLARIAGWKGWEGGRCRLPLDLRGAAAGLLAASRPEALDEVWAAGMAMALPGADPAIDQALAAVQSRAQPGLAVEWSPAFDF